MPLSILTPIQIPIQIPSQIPTQKKNSLIHSNMFPFVSPSFLICSISRC